MKWQTATDTVDVETVSVADLSGPWQAWSRGGWLMGMTIANLDPAVTAHVDFYDGTSTGGDYLFTMVLAVGATSRQSPGLPGVPIESALFLNVTAGSVAAGLTIGRPQ